MLRSELRYYCENVKFEQHPKWQFSAKRSLHTCPLWKLFQRISSEKDNAEKCFWNDISCYLHLNCQAHILILYWKFMYVFSQFIRHCHHFFWLPTTLDQKRFTKTGQCYLRIGSQAVAMATMPLLISQQASLMDIVLN